MVADTRTATTSATADKPAEHAFREQLRRGFLGPMPLWPGVVPFGFAYALLSRASGFSGLETALSSLLVYAGSAQLAMVTLYGSGAGLVSIVVTAAILNLRHILYALSINRRMQPGEQPDKVVIAPLMTDEAYGLTMREYQAGRGSAAYLFGAGISLYVIWTLSTVAGVLFGSLLPDPERLGLDFIFPLSFMALLLPLLRSRIAVIVAVVAAISALVVGPYASGGVTFLTAAVTAAGLGAALDRNASPRGESETEGEA